MTPDAGETRGFRDRSLRLRAFGVLTVLLGCGSLGLAALHLLLPWLGELASVATPRIDPRSLLSSALVYALGGAVLVPVGIGSYRRRRWAPPLVRVLATIWLLAGVITTAFVVFLLGDLVAAATAGAGGAVPAGVDRVLRSFLVVTTAGMGIALPALYLFAYAGRDVARTCTHHDPRPSAATACPEAVLALAIALALMGLLLLPMALKPAVPLFGWLVTGAAGAAILVGLAAVSLLLAAGTLGRGVAAWWGTLALLVGMGVSTVATFLRVDAVRLYEALGYAGAFGPGLAHGTARFFTWGSVVLTAASVAYMLSIRRHFGVRSRISTSGENVEM